MRTTVFFVILSYSSTLFAAGIPANTLPTGGQVSAGRAAIQQSGASMNVNQSTQNAIINWQQFNIGSQAGVRFIQPNSESATLNRVLSSNPSQIFGSLSANGNLFLINPSGIIFGAGSRVDAGGFVASTLNMNDDDFMAARYRFMRNGATGSILNQGTLNATDKGYIALLAPEVRNEGVIAARLGTVALAAGEKVTLNFSGEGLVNVAVDPAAIDTLIENRHLVQADGGRVIMSASAADKLYSSVINTSGEVRARGIESREGRIFLDSGAGGQTTVSGKLDVSSADGKGGSIIAAGERVLVKSGAHLTASGATGGGEVLVGGSWQGTESAIRQAVEAKVEKGALLESNALDNGDGGTVVLWSDVKNPLSLTLAHGTFEARGGPNGGDGGRVETSGNHVDITGVRVDASATRGKGGAWLIDPTDVIIDAAYSRNLLASLNSGTDVTVQTLAVGAESGNITVGAPLATVGASAGALSLVAHNNIILNEGISLTGTGKELNLKAGGAISGGGALSSAGRIIKSTGTSGSGSLGSAGAATQNTGASSGAAGSAGTSTQGTGSGGASSAGTGTQGTGTGGSGAVSSTAGTTTQNNGTSSGAIGSAGTATQNTVTSGVTAGGAGTGTQSTTGGSGGSSNTATGTQSAGTSGGATGGAGTTTQSAGTTVVTTGGAGTTTQSAGTTGVTTGGTGTTTPSAVTTGSVNTGTQGTGSSSGGSSKSGTGTQNTGTSSGVSGGTGTTTQSAGTSGVTTGSAGKTTQNVAGGSGSTGNTATGTQGTGTGGSVANAGSIPANTLPTGGTVVSGQAAVTQNNASMQVNQSTQNAIINWQQFNIGSQASVRFNQPSSSSATLNRVLATNPSQIFGSLSANGSIILINPSGIVFGAGSRVDAGSFVASTLNMNNNDFLAGRYTFGGSVASNTATGTKGTGTSIGSTAATAGTGTATQNSGTSGATTGTAGTTIQNSGTSSATTGNAGITTQNSGTFGITTGSAGVGTQSTASGSGSSTNAATETQGTGTSISGATGSLGAATQNSGTSGATTGIAGTTIQNSGTSGGAAGMAVITTQNSGISGITTGSAGAGTQSTASGSGSSTNVGTGTLNTGTSISGATGSLGAATQNSGTSGATTGIANTTIQNSGTSSGAAGTSVATTQNSGTSGITTGGAGTGTQSTASGSGSSTNVGTGTLNTGTSISGTTGSLGAATQNSGTSSATTGAAGITTQNSGTSGITTGGAGTGTQSTASGSGSSTNAATGTQGTGTSIGGTAATAGTGAATQNTGTSGATTGAASATTQNSGTSVVTAGNTGTGLEGTGSGSGSSGSTVAGTPGTSSPGGILNLGALSAAAGGHIVLVAPTVSNEGVIAAQQGTVVLAAGEQVTLNLSGKDPVNAVVDPASINTSIDNKGLIQADGGRVVVSASASGLNRSTINSSGEIRAQGVGSRQGSIVLDSGSGGQTTVSGKLDVSSADGKGGRIVATDERVLVKSGAHLTASGASGGGEVLVGGSWQGKDSAVRQATGTVVEKGAMLEANATVKGDGGTVVAWSDVKNPLSVTRAYGTFEAKGGPKGGDGGRIETSGHWLDVAGSQGGASAPKGKAGVWLFDPYNVTITGSDANGVWSAANPDVWTPSGSGSTINAATINAKLNTGTSVTVTTNGGGSEIGDITVSSAITKTAGNADVSLTLNAANSIIVDQAISNTGGLGKLHVTLDADNDGGVGDGAGIILLNADIATNGGNLSFGTGRTATIGGVSTLVGGDVYVAGAGVRTLSTNGGTIDVKGETIVANTNGLTMNSNGGNIRFYGLLNSGNSYTGVNSPGTDWNTAKGAAQSGDGSSVGNTYLATMRRHSAHWNAGEPNNNGGANLTVENESALQFTGNLGQWNDLNRSGGFGHLLAYYVKETNLASSPLTINAGSGTVTFSGAVGGSKALSELNVTAGNISLNSGVTTSGGQTYTGNVLIGGTNVSLSTVGGGSSGSDMNFSGDINSVGGANNLWMLSGSGRINVAGSVGNTGQLGILALGGTGEYIPATNQTFSYTGGVQNWTAPNGVASVGFDVQGAQGGNGGLGGRVTGNLSVTSGSLLSLYVGGAGSTGSGSAGGWNGGGAAGVSSDPNGSNVGSGGGASDIRTGGTGLSDRVVVAGGGGGRGGWAGGAGGAGGDLTGGSGAAGQGGGGAGGTQSSGGAGGAGNGTGGAGGSGASGSGGSGGAGPYGGGGGGGGYYGGGAGGGDSDPCCGDGGGGGGGSSYVGAQVSGASYTQGYRSGSGQITLTSAATEIFNPGNQTGAIQINGSVNVGKLKTAAKPYDLYLGLGGGSSIGSDTTIASQGKLTIGSGLGGQLLTVSGALSTSGSSLVELGGSVTSSGGQTYDSAVKLLSNATLTANNAPVAFSSTVNAATAGAQSLTVNSGTGATTFGGAVGGSKALSSLDVTAGTIAINGGGVATQGTQSYNGNITLGSASTTLTQTNAGADFTLQTGRSITNATGSDGTLTIKTSGSIIMNAGSSIGSAAGKLNTVLWANANGGGAGYISLPGTAASPVSINTNGGGLWMGGGGGTANWTPYSGAAPLTVGNGYATGTASQSIGVYMRSSTIGTSGGNVAIYGDSGAVAAAGGDLGQEADGIRFGGYPLGSNTGVTINAGAGNILLNGRSRGTSGNYAMGVEFDAVGGITHSITSAAASGDAITIIGDASGSAANSITGGVYFLNGATALSATGGGGVNITGTAGNPSPSNHAILAQNLTTIDSTGTVTLNTGSGSGAIEGVISGTGGLTKAGSGTLTLSGVNTYTGATTVSAGTLKSGAAGVISDGSAVSISGGATWDLNSYNETVGSISGAGNISLGSAALTAGGDNSSTALSGVISGTGSLTKAGTGTLTLSGANAYTGTTTVGAGTLRSGAAGVISDGSAVSVSGGATWDLNSYNETVGSISGAGNISLGSAALTAGGDNSSTAVSGVISGTGSLTKAGTGTLTLSGANTYTGATTINGGTLSIAAASGIGSGNVVLGGGTLEATGDVNLAARAVTTTADSTMSAAATKTISGGIFNASGHILTLAGGGNFTLTNTGNDFGAVTVTNGKNVTLIDANALTLSEVNSTGAIDIATLTGNLTLAGAINTTDASANAINLNAGKNAAAGAAAGGNIIVNGGSVSVGAGGIAALYSGSVAGSTGLTALIGEGSGRFRYNSDEATTNYTTPLGSGINAIYRERPIVKVTANNDGKIYDGIAYRGGAGATYSGFVNGDNSAGLGGSLAYGGSSQGAVNAQTYNISPSGLTSGLGYELTYIDGRLTITPAALTVTASNAAKTYGQTVAFNGSEFTSSGLKNGETIGSVSLTSGGAAATAGVSGSPYAITPSAAAGGSFNAGNYAITYANGRLTVNPAALTVTANNGTKTYGNTLTFNGTEFTSSGLQNGETIGGVSLTSGGAAATAGVTGSPYAITPSNATGGSFNAGNYTIAYVNGHLTVVPPTLSACVANPTAPGCTAVLPNPATVANQTSFINALIGAGSSLPPALPPVIAPPPQLLIEIVSEPVEPSIAQAPVSPPPETATTPPPSEPAVAALPAAPEPAAGAPPSVVASGVPAGEGTTPEPAKPAPAEPPAADGPTAPSESTAPAAPPAVAAAPSTEPGAPAAEPAPAPGPAATAAEGFSPSALASGSIDAASLSAMSPEFQSVLSNALARGLSPAEAVQRASNAAAESAAAARADNSPAASLASGSFATSSPIADSPEYQAALSSLLARGVSPAEAMRRAESATAESAAAARADSSPAALLASGSFATSPSAASPAFQAALSSLLARGVSPAEAMRRAESAAAESAAAARADGSPAALLASGSFATSPSAASPAFQAALSSLLARGLSPAEAMQRAESAAAESAAAVLADAKNPLAVLAAGNVAVLEKFPPSGDFSKALAAAMAQGIPMDIAMNRAMQAEALEQQAIRADAASPLAGLSSGKSSLPVGNSDFDQALAGAIGRGASPAEAVAAAKQTLARMPADVQTPSTALATGRNVDEILGAVGASPTFERALGNALARGMTIDAAVVYAKRVESTTALRLPLPPDLAKQVPSAAGSVTVTTVSGKPLPGWIRYDAPSRSFIVYDAPSGALPMEVAITVKGKRTVLRISENMGGR